MNNNIVIIGSGQHARVVLYNAVAEGKYNVVGFISHDKTEIGNMIDGVPVIGTDDMIDHLIEKHAIMGYILGLGGMKIRRKLIDIYDSNNNIRPVTIIHPHAVIAPNAVVGEGTLIECGCLVTPNPVIGRHCVVNTMTGVNHDNILEENVYLASGITLSGGVKIGKDTLIDDGVVITLGKSVGKNCIVGAGAVVTKDIDDNSVAYGVPAKVIRSNL